MKRAVYRRGLRTYFSQLNLPKKPELEMLDVWIARAQQGNAEARKNLILAHIRLVLAIAGGICARNQQKLPLYDEYVAVGMLTLINCVDRVISGEHTLTNSSQLGGYVNKSVSHEIRSFMKTDRIVVPPLQSAWLEALIKEQGSEVLELLFGTITYVDTESTEEATDDAGLSEDKIFRNPDRRNSFESGLYTPDCKANLGMQELLNTPYLTQRERIIMQQRIEGYSVEEIGEALNLSKQSISKILRERIGPIMARVLSGEL